MKYFIDTEFLEGTQKENFPISLFRKNTLPTIDLISIGIVAEDGREYYGISKDFNLKEAWNRFDVAEQTPFEKYHQFSGRKIYWLRENVLLPIWRDLFFKADADSGLSNRQTENFFLEVSWGDYDQYFTFESFKYMINRFGKTNKEIAQEVKDFCSKGTAYSCADRSIASIMHFAESDAETLADIKKHNLTEVYNEIPEFYAYYADYDWVAFCWLFGKMMDLPKGFPMYCLDLKQMLDEKAKNLIGTEYITFNTFKFEEKTTKSNNIENYIQCIENSKDYPKQTNEHNALADAQWNKKLYQFLSQF